MSLTVIEVWKEFRSVDVPIQRQKKKKMIVQAGKNISLEDFKENQNTPYIAEDLFQEKIENDEKHL